MHSRSASGEGVDAYLQEWRQWMHEHGEWLDDVAIWDRQLRRLMVLIHELDSALPYERQRLAEHQDAIQSHLRVLESHQGVLSGHKGRMTGEATVHAVADMHGRQRYQHARVRDAHMSLRHRHTQAMQQVDELLNHFRKMSG